MVQTAPPPIALPRRPGPRAETGASVVETLAVLPVLLMVMFLIIELSMLFKDSLLLTDGIRTGGRTLAQSRGQPDNACDAAAASLYAAAPDLDPDLIAISVTIDGTAHNSDDEGGFCTGLTLEAGAEAIVRATYPCSVEVFGVDLAPDCELVARSALRIE